MATKATAFLITLFLLFTAEAGAITGNHWKQQFSQAEQLAFVVGVVEAWGDVTSPEWGDVTSPETMKKMGHPREPNLSIEFFNKLFECVRNKMPYGQVFAIVNKYMDDNPSKWHYGMASLVGSALYDACEFKGK